MISHIFLGIVHVINTEEGTTLVEGVCMSDTNYNLSYLILVRLLVTNQVCHIFEVEIVLTC